MGHPRRARRDRAIRRINAFAAALASTATLALAAAQAQPNTGDPVHDGYCAALEDQAREAAAQLLEADSAMTNRYWINRLNDAHRRARQERCEWYEGGPVDRIEPGYRDRFISGVAGRKHPDDLCRDLQQALRP